MRLPQRIWPVLYASWDKSTHKQYTTYLKQWGNFCNAHHQNPLKPHVNDLLEFLHDLFDNGKSYSAIASARSCLSAFIVMDGQPMGSHPLINKYVHGVQLSRPSLPKYVHTWDPTTVLQYIVNWGPTENLCRELLTRRTLLLFLLATGQRVQTARLLKRPDIYWTDTDCVITYTSRLKNRVPGKNGLVLKFKKFSDSALCVYTHLKQYESL